MALEPEPNYLNVANLGNFGSTDVVPEEQCDFFVNNLQSENLDVDVILGDTNTKVPGRIKGKLEAYLEADASKYVLQSISEGYRLIFINDIPPPTIYLPNNKSALSQKTFLYSELIRLEQFGCIRKVSSRNTVLADLSRIPFLVRRGDYMTVNDLDSGYWQVPIYPPHQTYLGLSYQHEDLSLSFWVWVVMPLGIVDAAHIFTALTDPLMDCILLKGMRANIYIDDLLSVCQDKDVKAFFARGGWVFKPSKSSGPPSQRVTYLGLVINSIDMIFEIGICSDKNL